MLPSLQENLQGFSESEKYLGRIAQQTFLSFWSHLNLFRSRNKELADLIIIFDEHIIIFSDKSCALKEGEHGWSRWHKRAVLESAQQLYRAAGWIRKHPQEIFTDVKCDRRFPLHLPSSPAIHLVAVATGAREAAALHLNSNGALAIRTDECGNSKFVLGDIDRNKEFVHIFDDVSLSLLLKELDTTSDFVLYLQKRAKFLRSGPVIAAPSESSLLAYYLKNMNDSEHDFILPGDVPTPTHVMVDEDWDKFVSSAPYLRKKSADSDSYLWDRVIENVTFHADQGTLEVGQENGLAGNEEALRFLAKETRFSRRHLARSLIEVRNQVSSIGENIYARTLMVSGEEDKAFVFCAVRSDAVGSSKYRAARRAILRARVEAAKLRNDALHTVIGIAVAGSSDSDESVDIAVRVYPDPWPAEARTQAEELCRTMGVPLDLSRAKVGHWRDHEYPAPPLVKPRATYQKKDAEKDAAKAKRKAQKAARKRNRH